jgi:hypothetical protein
MADLTPEQQQLANDVQEAQQAPDYREGQHSSGYFDSTYKWQGTGEDAIPPEGSEGALPEGSTPEQQSEEMAALAAKLGIDPNQLGKSQEELDANKPPLPVDDWYSQQFGTQEAQQFAESFKKYVGIDIKEAYQLMNNTAQVTKGLESWRAQVQTERDLGILQQEFGNEFDQIMPLVAQEFQRIKAVNPQQAAALDNVDGARYLAAYIRQRGIGATQPNQLARQDVPQFNFPNVRTRHTGGSSTAPTIRMSEFIKWTDDDVQRRYNEVVAAKQAGTFIYDL